MSQQQGHGPTPRGAPRGGPQTPPRLTAPNLTTASMGRRLGARLLDGLVLGVPAALVIGGLAVWATLSAGSSGEPFAAPLIIVAVLACVLLLLATVAYEVVLTASGGTLGKRWLGLLVVRRDRGGLPGARPAVRRWLILLAAGVVPVIGTALVCLSPFFDRSGLRQGWHDKVAGARVIDVRDGLGSR